MSAFSLIMAILSLVTALVPLADHGLQFIDHRRQQSPPMAVTVNKPVLPVESVPRAMVPVPPEAGRRNVVFHNGAWWKFENGQWLVWTNQPQQLAQGGYAHAVR